MNAANIKLASTVVAAALGLALGLAAAPAMADPPVEGEDHNHGGGSDGEDTTLFTVTLDSLISADPLPLTNAVECFGTTEIQANPGLSADFFSDQGCTVSVAIDELGAGTVLDLSLFRVEVKTKKSGTNLRLYFTTQTIWAPHTDPLQNETIYASDSLSAMITFNEDLIDLFLSPTGASGLVLTKIHQPDKGAETNPTITVGVFQYVPL